MATDFAHPTSKRALNELASKKTLRTLLKYATRLAGSEAGGNDLMQLARLQVCNPDEDDGGRPWDPSRGTFLRHMRMLLLDTARKGWRRAQSRREFGDDEVVADEPAPESDAGPQHALQRKEVREKLAKLGEILRGRLSGLALEVFHRLCVDDEEKAAATAQACGCTVDDVYNANRQIAYHAARVRAEYDAEEHGKVMERRARASAMGVAVAKPQAEEEGP